MREGHVNDLLEAPGLRGHDHAAVAEQQRLLDRMRHIDDGLAGLLPDADELGLQEHPVLCVKCGERLVHQEHGGVGHEGARDRASLPHAAGELVRIVAPEFCQAHELERSLDPRGGLAATHSARHQSEADIGLDAHPRKQAAVLEHHGVLDRPAFGGDCDVAAGLPIEPGEDTQQCRFSAAARADDAEELPRRNAQGDVVERKHAALAADIFLAQPNDVDRSAAPLNGHRVIGSRRACFPCFPAETTRASQPPRGYSWG